MLERLLPGSWSAGAVTVLVVLLGAGSAVAVPFHTSVVTIKAERETEVFRGRVVSTSRHCYVGRAVRVFRARTGRDLYLTRAFTNEAGRWRAIIPAQHAKHIYAKVREETVPPDGVARARCSGDKSRTIVG